MTGFVKIGYVQDLNNYRDINGVWDKFCQAFDLLDYQLMAEIHSNNLIRIPNGKQIIDYNNYIMSYKKDFEVAKEQNSTRTISLRFYERINNDSIASEKGIYKLVINKNKPEETAHYGKFHVLLIKEKVGWRIFMDYDSNEGGKVGEEDFIKAFVRTDYDRFIKN
jgi:hypothetical protein